jgi:hypothetical protein
MIDSDVSRVKAHVILTFVSLTNSLVQLVRDHEYKMNIR